ncbi:reverse transcriptase domain-containing protein [Tanacetum coccineum]
MKFLVLHKNSRRLLVKRRNDLRSCLELVPITDLRSGNLLSKTTRETLNIIENKSKVCYSRNRSYASRMNATSSKTDERIDKIADQISTLVEIVSKKVVTSALVKAVEETCVTCGVAHSCTAQIPPPVIPISIPEPDVLKTLPKTIPIPEPNVPKNLPKPNIPYPLRRDDQKSRDKASNQMEKISNFQICRFDNSFAGCLLLMQDFKNTVLEREFASMLLKKLPEKLGDPDKFLIPCNFPGMDVCHALADLELADRSITYPKGLAEDVFVKVRKFHFPTDFVVVNFADDPRVPLILGRSFLRTGRALIDVFGEEITLRVDNKAVTFNLDQTTRYSFTNDKSVNRIDIIDAVCEEYAPKFLGFSNSSGGNPTPTSEPFTSEFILEEIEAYLKDDSISPEIDYADCNPEEDICLIKKLLNNDPFQLPPMDLKQSEVTEAKSSIEEPLELELKDLPSHLEYAYLEENDKLPVIIAKGLKNDEKDALLKVLKSHKRAIAWKITDIKGIDPRFRTHKILMEDDYKPTVQSQRQVNPKIHECMMAMFHDMIEKTMEVFMDDFSVFGDSFDSEGIVLGHKISKSGIEVDHAKVDVIAKLPHPTIVKGVRSFLGHAGFYRRFIQDFSKIARPMTHLLEKETPFVFSKECIDAFQTLKRI